MEEYNQDRFELEIQAKEVQPPERIAMAKVFVSIVSASASAQHLSHACMSVKSAAHQRKRKCINVNPFLPSRLYHA
jgi:hypothetical protein